MYYLMRACAKGSLRTITQHYDAALAQKLESVAHGGSWNFAYRWMLMDFKREFPFGEIPALWERIWAKFATSHFHVFVRKSIFRNQGTSPDYLTQMCTFSCALFDARVDW